MEWLFWLLTAVSFTAVAAFVVLLIVFAIQGDRAL